LWESEGDEKHKIEARKEKTKESDEDTRRKIIKLAVGEEVWMRREEEERRQEEGGACFGISHYSPGFTNRHDGQKNTQQAPQTRYGRKMRGKKQTVDLERSNKGGTRNTC